MKRLLVALALVLISPGLAYAQPKTPYQKVMYMTAMVDMYHSMAVTQVDLGNLAGAYEGINKAKESLPENLDIALTVAKDKPALLEAVKGYYISANECLNAFSSQPKVVHDRICLEMRSKEKAIQLELKLLGINPPS